MKTNKSKKSMKFIYKMMNDRDRRKESNDTTVTKKNKDSSSTVMTLPGMVYTCVSSNNNFTSIYYY